MSDQPNEAQAAPQTQKPAPHEAQEPRKPKVQADPQPSVEERMRKMEERQAEDSARSAKMEEDLSQMMEILKSRQAPDVQAPTATFEPLDHMESDSNRIITDLDGNVISGIADQMEDVTYEQVEAKMNEYVTAMFLHNPHDQDGFHPICAFHNGKEFRIPRGVPTKIKLYVVVMICDCWQAEHYEGRSELIDKAHLFADKNVNLVNINTQVHPRYMVSLIGESANDELAQRILQRSINTRPSELGRLTVASETDPSAVLAAA